MRHLLSVLALGGAALVTGCGGSDGLTETVLLKTGQPKTADGGALTLRLDKFADSRCPRNTTCVTAGAAVIDLTLTPAGQSATTLQMTLSGAADAAKPTATVGGYQIEFNDIQPYPSSPVLTITDSEVTLVVRR